MSMPVSGPGGGDDAADVAVGDQHDARAGRAHLGDQLGVARAVEDADDQIGDIGLLGLRQVLQVDRRLPSRSTRSSGSPPPTAILSM